MSAQQQQRQKGGRRPAPRQQQGGQPHVLSNLQSFLIHSAPCLPVRSSCDELESPTSSGGAHFTLQDLWQSYEAWSAYGCEVPMRICVDGVWQEIIQCYTPHLAGLQLFGADHTRRIPASARCAAMSGYCSEEEGEGCEAGSVGGGGGCDAASSCSSSAFASSTASTASTTSDSDGEDACKDSPTAAAAAARRLARAAARGSVLGKARHLGEPSQPLFQYMEAERPHLRLPLHDQVAELAERCPELQSLTTRDLHPTSWFAVTWVPIYRVPSVPDPAASRELQANFLTFHSLAVPQQRLHASPADLCSLAPLPPLLDPIGAAAVAWRTEVARQHLLAAALSAMAVQQQQQQRAAAAAAVAAAAAACDSGPTSPSGSACSAACTPVSARSGASSAGSLAGQLAGVTQGARAAAAAAASRLAALPLAAACLRPFAFMPYKASGAAWVDDWNLQRQHLPMVAAAGSWVERRKVQLPDFEFFGQMYRPLPTGYQPYRSGR